jgi:hypothetical protein
MAFVDDRAPLLADFLGVLPSLTFIRLLTKSVVKTPTSPINKQQYISDGLRLF